MRAKALIVGSGCGDGLGRWEGLKPLPRVWLAVTMAVGCSSDLSRYWRPVARNAQSSVIRVNDRHEVPWREGMTVSTLLDDMGYTYHEIIVKVDGELVRKASYDTYAVPEGADVKAIHLIAGG